MSGYIDGCMQRTKRTKGDTMKHDVTGHTTQDTPTAIDTPPQTPSKDPRRIALYDKRGNQMSPRTARIGDVTYTWAEVVEMITRSIDNAE